MTASLKLLKGDLIVPDPGTGVVKRTIALQYYPDSLTRPPTRCRAWVEKPGARETEKGTGYFSRVKRLCQ